MLAVQCAVPDYSVMLQFSLSLLFIQFFSQEENNKIISEDLRISQVKSTEEQDRRYCFELIMPSK